MTAVRAQPAGYLIRHFACYRSRTMPARNSGPCAAIVEISTGTRTGVCHERTRDRRLVVAMDPARPASLTELPNG
jgi:hypothetical protein